MTGSVGILSVGILNVGAGDTKLTFDKDNPIETARACRIVKDMIRRGYVLFVEVIEDGKKIMRRALDFDDNTAEYIIADLDPLKAQEVDHADAAAAEAPAPQTDAGADTINAGLLPRNGRRGRKSRTKRVSASTTTAVSVPRTAGG